MFVRAQPIYGNGWTDGTVTVDEPEPFDVELTSDDGGDLAGHIVSVGHILNSHGFQASQRHEGQDDCYDCQILLGNRILLRGYCTLEKVRKVGVASSI